MWFAGWTKSEASTSEDKPKANRTAKTTNLYAADVASMFRHAMKDGLLLSNPAAALARLPELDSTEREVFSVAEVGKLVKTAGAVGWQAGLFALSDPKRAARSENWQGMILVGFYAGARIGDCARLTWGNVNLTKKTLLFMPVTPTTSAKPSPVPSVKCPASEMVTPPGFRAMRPLSGLAKCGTISRMKGKLNTRQEKFCEFIAAGETQAEAYLKAGFKVTLPVARRNASRLLTNADIQAHLAKLRSSQTTAAMLARNDKRIMLARIAKDETVKVADRIRAIEVDAKIAGHFEPERLQVDPGPHSLATIQERARRVASALSLAPMVRR